MGFWCDKTPHTLGVKIMGDISEEIIKNLKIYQIIKLCLNHSKIFELKNNNNN